jgi:hypothetical protein
MARKIGPLAKLLRFEAYVLHRAGRMRDSRLWPVAYGVPINQMTYMQMTFMAHNHHLTENQLDA